CGNLSDIALIAVNRNVSQVNSVKRLLHADERRGQRNIRVQYFQACSSANFESLRSEAKALACEFDCLSRRNKSRSLGHHVKVGAPDRKPKLVLGVVIFEVRALQP